MLRAALSESNFLTKSFERKISYSKNTEDSSEPKEDISINILETFSVDTPEFKENFAKVPTELLDLFKRQFDSHAKALRVGKIITKEDKKKAKKLSEDSLDEPIFNGEEEEYA